MWVFTSAGLGAVYGKLINLESRTELSVERHSSGVYQIVLRALFDGTAQVLYSNDMEPCRMKWEELKSNMDYVVM